ncbi:hypothetical protein HDU98_000084 [Podochytrium sp. JEL0797]|nr:hypothetical protein HDU98_000084 [Podochytrium sp. JEL0797]
MADTLASRLVSLGLPSSEKHVTSLLEWTFAVDESALRPFLDWLSVSFEAQSKPLLQNNAASERLFGFSVLSEEEAAAYEELVKSSLKISPPSAPLLNEDEFDFYYEDNEAVDAEIADLELELAEMREYLAVLEQEESILTDSKAEVEQQSLDLIETEETVSQKLTKQSAILENTSLKMDVAARDLLARIDQIIRNASTSEHDEGIEGVIGQSEYYLFQCIQPLASFIREDETLSENMISFYEEEFNHNRTRAASETLESNSTAETTQGLRKELQMEMERLTELHAFTEQQRLDALLACTFAETKLKYIQQSDISSSGVSQQKTTTKSHLIASHHLHSQITATQHPLPSLLSTLAAQTVSHAILQTDATSKLARHTSLLTRLESFTRRLLAQQSRHQFLAVAFETEWSVLKRVAHVLESVREEVGGRCEGFEGRRGWYRLDEFAVEKVPSRLIDGRDEFMHRVMGLLDESLESAVAEHQSTNAVVFSSIDTVIAKAKTLVQAVKAAESEHAQAEASRNEIIKQMAQANNDLVILLHRYSSTAQPIDAPKSWYAMQCALRDTATQLQPLLRTAGRDDQDWLRKGGKSFKPTFKIPTTPVSHLLAASAEEARADGSCSKRKGFCSLTNQEPDALPANKKQRLDFSKESAMSATPLTPDNALSNTFDSPTNFAVGLPPPYEITANILSYLPDEDRLRCRSVCHLFNSVVNKMGTHKTLFTANLTSKYCIKFVPSNEAETKIYKRWRRLAEAGVKKGLDFEKLKVDFPGDTRELHWLCCWPEEIQSAAAEVFASQGKAKYSATHPCTEFAGPFDGSGHFGVSSKLRKCEHHKPCVIPASISKMTKLERIKIVKAELVSPIPQELFSVNGKLTFKFLNMLDLSQNLLDGPIPPEIGNFNLLSHLNLSCNSFSGTLPDSFENLHCLTYFSVARNRLSGEISEKLVHGMSHLVHLLVNDNAFSGEFPLEKMFSRLHALMIVNLSNNKFTGCFPETVANKKSKMSFLGMSNNRFSGPLPRGLGGVKGSQGVRVDQGLLQLRELRLENNRFDGMIPVSIGNLKLLRILMINNNHFTGPLPAPISNMRDLQSLYAQNNQFSTLEFKVSRMKNLRKLHLAHNALEGVVVDATWFGGVLKRLEVAGNCGVDVAAGVKVGKGVGVVVKCQGGCVACFQRKAGERGSGRVGDASRKVGDDAVLSQMREKVVKSGVSVGAGMSKVGDVGLSELRAKVVKSVPSVGDASRKVGDAQMRAKVVKSVQSQLRDALVSNDKSVGSWNGMRQESRAGMDRVAWSAMGSQGQAWNAGMYRIEGVGGVSWNATGPQGEAWNAGMYQRNFQAGYKRMPGMNELNQAYGLYGYQGGFTNYY